ncbi:hypothetical protein [Rhodococcus olei]
MKGEEGPLVSPVDEGLHELPPVMIHVGATEIVRGGAERMADRQP